MGIVLVYDITNKGSFDFITNQFQTLNTEYAPPNVVYVLVGSKCDMESRREVPKERGEQLAAQLCIPFLEISAKENINIDETFETMTRLILKKIHGDNYEIPTRKKSTPDYAPYLEKAAARGTITTRQSSLGLCGAAGTGKTSTVRLLTGQEPVKEHDSTPLLKPEQYYKADDAVKPHPQPKEDNNNSDWEWNSDEEEEEPPQTTPANKQQTVAPVKQDLLIARGDQWQRATHEILLDRLAIYVRSVAEGKEATGFTMQLTETSNHPSAPTSVHNASSNSTTIETTPQPPTGASATPTDASDPAAPLKQNPASSSCDEIARNILDIVKSNKDLQSLGITHFVSTCDTGGQAAFLDVAPAFLRYNSVNLVLLKLDENLEDPAQFFYSVKGVKVGDEKRQISTRDLVHSFVSSKSKIRKPRMEGTKVVKSYQKPMFMILGTHYDKYKNGGCSQSKEEKNEMLKKDLSAFKDCLYSNGKDKMMFSLDTLARDKATEKLASKIRKLVMENYVEVEIPLSWYIFQLAMNSVKTGGNEGMIPLSILWGIGSVSEMSQEEVKAVLHYFHDLHVCLYYPSVASNVVFTNPQFLFDKISEIIACSFGKSKIGMTEGEVEKLTERGLFNEKFLTRVCKGFKEDVFSQSDFLALMDYLFIVSSLPDTDEYFMPCVLAVHPNPCEDFIGTSLLIEPLLLTWRRSVPNGLFTSLTTKVQAREGINGIRFFISQVTQQYRNKITLTCHDLGCNVTLIECNSFITIGIITTRTEQPHEVPDRCVKIRGVALNCIKGIVKQFGWELDEPEEAFLCKICPITSSCASQPHSIHMCYCAITKTVLSCEVSGQAKLTDSHSIWWMEKGASLNHSNQLILGNVFVLLQEKSSQWDDIGQALGISINDRDNLRHDSSIDNNRRLESVLYKWLESAIPRPTWSDFIKILTSDLLKLSDVAEQTRQFVSTLQSQ